MKKLFICVLILCLAALTGCGDKTKTFSFDVKGSELRLREEISVSTRDGWDRDDLTQWYKCDIYYYKSVVGLVFRQKAEDSGYIVFDTHYQLYFFIHAFDDACVRTDHNGQDVGCINLNTENIIKVVLIK